MLTITYSETHLVKRHRGTMPIILTCPHDGTEQPAHVSERTEAGNPAACGSFKTGRDLDAADIAERVAQKILETTGLSPYVVIARFHRKFIDGNRERDCAFQDAAAGPFYDEYHDRIRGYVRQILAENDGRGFLFDIHGTGVIASDPADLYLGTANGATLSLGFPRERLFERHGLHGLLAAVRRTDLLGGPFRYTVSPADASTTETGVVNGGFTVRNQSEQLNGIQIEVARPIREDGTKRGFLVEDLAFAIPNFVRRYAPF
jgi:hypothetical protein